MHEFDKCVIVDTDRNPIVEGFVRAFESGVMEITTVKDTTGWVYDGQDVRIHIYNASMGECVYDGRIQTALLTHVRLTALKLVANRQKRNNTRVNTELEYLFRFYADSDGEHPFEKPLHVTILNVSAEGIYIACKERFDIGFNFVFAFRETPRDIPLTAEIVRREISPNGFHYGCHFVNISQKDSNEIHRWVFGQQIELRRKQTF
ncbi:MAG: PilZ domain-containing protein [Ethanoligenens sp.]